MSRWDGIEELLAVVDRGSFTAAAKALGVSKSFVSKQVSSLESRLGARLVHRTTRQLGLTEVGESFYDGCLRMAQQYERIEQLVTSLQENPKGLLRIAINNLYGVSYTAAAAAAVGRAPPDLEVHVTSSFEIGRAHV